MWRVLNHVGNVGHKGCGQQGENVGVCSTTRQQLQQPKGEGVGAKNVGPGTRQGMCGVKGNQCVGKAMGSVCVMWGTSCGWARAWVQGNWARGKVMGTKVRNVVCNRCVVWVQQRVTGNAVG